MLVLMDVATVEVCVDVTTLGGFVVVLTTELCAAVVDLPWCVADADFWVET